MPCTPWAACYDYRVFRTRIARGQPQAMLMTLVPILLLFILIATGFAVSRSARPRRTAGHCPSSSRTSAASSR